jgi:hypothetical protein
VSHRAGRLRLLTLFATAGVGLLGAHVLGYVALAPETSARAEVLAETGHGYLSRLTEVAVAAAILAGLASARLGMLRARGVADGGWSVRFLAVRLSVLQVAGYVVLEVAERVFSDAPVGGLGAVLLVGIPLQAVVASVAAALIALLERAGQAVARALGTPAPLSATTTLRVRPRRRVRPAGTVSWVPSSIRGPPTHLVTRS